MKKYIAMALALSLLLGLSACGQTEEKPNEEAGVPFTLYVDESTRMLINAFVARYAEEYELPKLDWNLVDCTALSAEEMEQRLRKELQTGKGPDLIFINANTCTDPERFLREVPLYDLTQTSGEKASAYEMKLQRTMEELEENCVQAGMLGEQLFLFPVTYNFPVLISTESVCKEAGLDLNKNTDLLSFLQMANQYYETHPNTEQSFLDQNGQLLEYVLRYGNLDLVDYDSKTVDSSNPKVEQVFTEYKKLAAYDQQANERKLGFQEGYFQLRDRNNVFLSTHEDRQVYFWFDYQSFYLQEKPVFYPLKDLNGNFQAVVTQSVAINPNTKNKENAIAVVEFLSAANYVVSEMVIPDLSCNSYWTALNFDLASDLYRDIPDSAFGKVPMQDLNEQDPVYDLYDSMIQSVNSAGFENVLYQERGMLASALQPYFDNRQSYEECMVEFAKQAEAFLKGEQ